MHPEFLQGINRSKAQRSPHGGKSGHIPSAWKLARTDQVGHPEVGRDAIHEEAIHIGSLTIHAYAAALAVSVINGLRTISQDPGRHRYQVFEASSVERKVGNEFAVEDGAD